ncbi:hypothetical protein, partial [Pseudomonas sp. RL]|uniref:hypothetical protein n=1 Tax=Pseudomonas sp. RL TaxID=1452718 RepID=UPI001C46A8BF
RDPMINSHLLYRLSYRGTSVFQILQLPAEPETPLQWRAFYAARFPCQHIRAIFFLRGARKFIYPSKA